MDTPKRLYRFLRTKRAQRIVRLVETLHAQAFLLLPVQFPVRRGAKLPVRDFSIKRQFPVAIQASYITRPRHQINVTGARRQ